MTLRGLKLLLRALGPGKQELQDLVQGAQEQQQAGAYRWALCSGKDRQSRWAMVSFMQLAVLLCYVSHMQI